MSAEITPIEDDFETYFTEKLWAWIPEFYKAEDLAAENPNVLRAFIQAFGAQAAVARRSIDRLWEDQFIEFCDDWAIPYIGELVKTRLISALNRRGRRVDVAKTIFYRRRKGTPLVLETLITDISGWDGVLVEAFRRMMRSRHGLDPKPKRLRGRVSGTYPGGWADIRRPSGTDLLDTPWDEYSHLFDPRKLRGLDGRYNISKLNFHEYRLFPFELNEIDPFQIDTGLYTVDPLGRDTPLFMPSARGDEWTPAREWEIAGPIRCRLFGDGEYVITQSVLNTLEDEGATPDQIAALTTIESILYRSAGRLNRRLVVLDAESGAAPPPSDWFARILELALITNCGKRQLLPKVDGSGQIVPDVGSYAFAAQDDGIVYKRRLIQSGNLGTWEDCLPDLYDDMVELVVDPVRGRLYYVNAPTAPLTTRAYYGFSGEVGAGTYDRRDFIVVPPTGITYSGGGAFADPTSGEVNEIEDSRTYTTDAIEWAFSHESTTLQVANQNRPLLVSDPSAGTSLTLKTFLDAASLDFEGVWLATTGGPVPGVSGALIIDGDSSGPPPPDKLTWSTVTFRHCTIDPGGARASGGDQIPFLEVVVDCPVDELVFDRCVLGRIRVGAASAALIKKLTIRDCIVVGPSDGEPALEVPLGDVELTRTTVFGDVQVNRLFASEALVQGAVQVTDNQQGCFRFSAAFTGSQHPPTFESHFLDLPNQFFTSTTFGDPGFAQLSELASDVIVRGGENGAEMGAFNSLVNPIKQDGLEAKIQEFQPVGRLPQYIRET